MMKRLAGFGCLVLILVIAISGLGAQDDTAPTPDATAELTAESALTQEPALPTPSVTPTVMLPSQTPTASETAPYLSTSEVALPTLTMTPSQTPQIPMQATPVRRLNVRDMFETLNPSVWTIDPAWQNIAGRAQTTQTAALHLNGMIFENGAAQASVLLAPESQFLLTLRGGEAGGYTALLEADRITLYRQEIAVTSVALDPAFERIMMMDIEQGLVRVSIGGQEVIAWVDAVPLPAGEIALQINMPQNATAPVSASLDDVFVWLPFAVDDPTPAPTFTPTPTAATIIQIGEPGGGPSPTPSGTVPPEDPFTPTPPSGTPPDDPFTPTATNTPPDITPTQIWTYTPTVVFDGSNDYFAYASPIYDLLNGLYVTYGSNAEATLEMGEPNPSCATAPIDHSVWYMFIAQSNGSYIAHTEGSDFDTVLAVYTSVIGQVTDLTQIACSDNASVGSDASSVALNLRAYSPVWIQLSGASGASGDYQLTIEKADLAAPLAPVLLAPANNAFVSQNTFVVEWQRASTGSLPLLYQIEVDDDPAFNSVDYAQIVTHQDDWQGAQIPTDTLVNGIYYWRVRAQNYEGVWGAHSAVRRVTLDLLPPAAPILNTPAMDARVTSTRPTLKWNSVADAALYRVELALDDAFLMPIMGYETTNPSLTLNASVLPNPLNQGAHYWRVAARDVAGNWGALSETRMFLVSLTNTPAHNSLVTSMTATRPTFTWVASGIANSQYKIEIAQETDFATPIYLSPSQSGLSHMIPTALNPGVYYWRVWVNDAVPVAGVYSKFTIGPAAPSTPQRVAPNNGAVIASSALVLQWTSPAANAQGGPFTYEYEIDNQQNFSSPEAAGNGVTDPQVAPMSLAEGTYWWHARVTNLFGTSSSWSSAGTFTIDNTPPAAPYLTSPVENAEISNTRSTLTWQTSPSANRYRVDVSSSEDFSVLVLENAETAGGNLALNAALLPNPLNQGLYFWRVSARDAAGNWSEESALSRFTVNLATAPAAQAALVTATTLKPVFKWAALGTAGTSYRVEVSTMADFSASVMSPTLTALQYTFPTSDMTFGHGTYYWRVWVNDAAPPAGVSRWFAVTSQAPGTPVLNAPANDSAVNATPMLAWGAVANVTGYQVEIDESGLFTTPQQGVTESAEYPLTAALTEGVYYWRVRSVNEDGAVSAWSSVFHFTLDLTPPAPPTLLQPGDNALVKTLQPAFSWTASPEAAQHMIQLSTTESFDLPLLYISPTTTFTPPAPLLTMSYVWRVAAMDAAGNVSSWSEVRHVIIETASNTAPLLNRFAMGMPEFSWTPISWAEGYELVISTNPTFNGQQVWAVTVGSPATTVTLPEPFANGVYYWRVRALSGPSTWGAWSSTGTFVIDA